MSITPYSPRDDELAPPMPTAPVPDRQTRALQNLSEWVHAADAAYQVAERLVQSAFVPTTFRGKPVEATAAILAGSEVGLSPMAALRSFDIISGQAAPRAITLRAIVQSYGHEVVLVESTATRAIVAGRRRGTTEWQKSTWTLDRAKEMGLTGKDNWRKQPGAMLVARATSEVCRLVAADAILGIGYTAEELADGATGDPAWTVEPSPAQDAATAPTRRMSRATIPAPEDATESADTPDHGTGEMITDAQRRALFRAFTAAGYDTDAHSDEGRTARLHHLAELLGRDIESTNDLTKAEASQAIDALTATGNPDQ